MAAKVLTGKYDAALKVQADNAPEAIKLYRDIALGKHPNDIDSIKVIPIARSSTKRLGASCASDVVVDWARHGRTADLRLSHPAVSTGAGLHCCMRVSHTYVPCNMSLLHRREPVASILDLTLVWTIAPCGDGQAVIACGMIACR